MVQSCDKHFICIFLLKARKNSMSLLFLSFLLKRFYLFIIREKGREGEREGEKYPCEKHRLLATKACALPGEWVTFRFVEQCPAS